MVTRLTSTDRNAPNPFPPIVIVAPGTAVDGCSSRGEGAAATTPALRPTHNVIAHTRVRNAFMNRPLLGKQTVCLVHLVSLVDLVQPNQPDKRNKQARRTITSGFFESQSGERAPIQY